jgi:hypothetical protein
MAPLEILNSRSTHHPGNACLKRRCCLTVQSGGLVKLAGGLEGIEKTKEWPLREIKYERELFQPTQVGIKLLAKHEPHLRNYSIKVYRTIGFMTAISLSP